MFVTPNQKENLTWSSTLISIIIGFNVIVVGNIISSNCVTSIFVSVTTKNLKVDD